MWRIEQSFNLIAYAAFIGIDHPGRAYLALSVLFHHEGLSLDQTSSRMRDLAGPRLVERARLLAALIRIAYPISAAMAGILPKTPLFVRDRRIVLELRTKGRLRASGYSTGCGSLPS